MASGGHKQHHHAQARASGGKIKGTRTEEWVSGNPDVKKETEGEESYDKGDERKRGGKVKRAKGGMVVEGHKSKHRMDRPGRKRGGAVGADRSPLSTAHKGYTGDGGRMNNLPGSKDTYGGTPKD